MTSFKVFQIRLSDEDYDKIHETGHVSVPKNKARIEIHVATYEDKDISSLVREAFDRGFYDHVADIEAADLEDVFTVGNVGPEELITRHAPMHSISVGDVIEYDDGWRYVVLPTGFAPVAFNRKAA
jgi:hypothetical protein